MSITAADVKKLRDTTGAGMMDAKKALTETDGDFDKAIELLRVKGQAKAKSRGEERDLPLADRQRREERIRRGEVAERAGFRGLVGDLTRERAHGPTRC